MSQLSRHPASPALPSTVDAAEVERFSRIADEWWDPTGKFAPLHRLGGPHRLYPRPHTAAVLRPRSAVGVKGLSVRHRRTCGGLLSRWRGWAPRSPASTLARNISVAGLQPKQALHRLSAPRARQGRRPFDIVLASRSSSTWPMSSVPQILGGLVKPGGLPVDLNRQGQARHRRRRICPRLAAARTRLEEFLKPSGVRLE
jgi:2-polyprenyl-6-hydroxyphenyl methylase/3-demethylubiquinone-9 3-methyltransferase